MLNLEHICEVLYKLHPSVLDDLVDMERTLGKILGNIDLNNVSLDEREFLSNILKEDFSNKTEEIKIEYKPEELETEYKNDNRFLRIIKISSIRYL